MAFQFEIDATKRIRERNPDVPQRTLARKIVDQLFADDSEDKTDACRIFATYATTYNRIRRIDGSIGGRRDNGEV